MINADGEKVHIEGTREQIEVELFLIMKTALEECPVQLAIALELMERTMDKDFKKERIDGKEARLAAFAAALSLLPEEERQRLKKEMEGD